MKTMNLFKKAWKSLESEEPLPRRLRNPVVVGYDELKNKILEQDPIFVQDIVESLYAGDVYVIKGVFPSEFMINLRKRVFDYGKTTPPSFHKMIEGCPNFHRIIDENIAKNYSFVSYKHSYYFFPWNKDPFNLFEETYKRWRIIKILSGLIPDEYETNTPKDGIVDRLQIVHYPSGTGRIETHSDPFSLQRLIISGIMSKRGHDYERGGVYFIDHNEKKVDFEDYFDVGDFALYFPTIHHGVNTIDEGKKPDWDSINGRWWFGPFSNASDHVDKRHTGYSVEETYVKK